MQAKVRWTVSIELVWWNPVEHATTVPAGMSCKASHSRPPTPTPTPTHPSLPLLSPPHTVDELLSLFRYPSRSGRALLNGTLPLRYCAVRFAHNTPTWRLPVSGQVTRLVAAYPDSAGDCSGEVFAFRVPLVSRSSPVRKRFRLNRKNPCTPRWCIGSFSSTYMEEVASGEVF